MRASSNLICLLLLTFALYHVSSAVVSDGEAARKLEADLFKIANALEDDEVIDVLEVEEDKESADEPDESGRRRDVLVPAGWGSFRRRISGAFRRVSDGIRRVFRKPWKICLGRRPSGARRPGPLNP